MMINTTEAPQFMGQWGELAASAFAAKAGGDGGGGGGGGGTGMPNTTTTVSPTFQQSFTPQVSPVIQVSQGGGEQRGATSQVAPGGQQAEGGATETPSGFPSVPGYDYSPSFSDSVSPFDSYGDYPEQYQGVFSEQKKTMGDYMPWVVLGIIAAGVAVYFLTQNKPKGMKNAG